MAIRFRQLGSEDVEVLTDQLLKWHRAEGLILDRGTVRREVSGILGNNQDWHSWLIEQKDHVAGYLMLNFRHASGPVEPRAYLAAMYVEPRFRRLGIGQYARRFVTELGHWLRVRIYDFHIEAENKHAALAVRPVALTSRLKDLVPLQRSA